MQPTHARLLVAEDSRSQRAYVADLLRREGFDVHEAEDGRVALDLCRIIRPDLVILDLEMPRLNGADVLARLRGDRKINSIPVLVLTADEREATVAEALDAGANDFVIKPARPVELLARVRRALREKAAVEELIERNQALVNAATDDALTGLPNRRASAQALAAALSQARASRLPLTVVIVGIDELNLINETRGSAVGDQVLCAVAGRLTDRTRPEDTIGRWSGDEFIAILSDAGPDVATNEADALREAVGGRPINIGDDSLVVTVSAGWASSVDAAAEDLVATANDGLHEAKASGRDCVRP
jgi:diguanylate cyclase (GGDEF)-like protein